MNEQILDYNYFSYRVYLVDPLKKVKSDEAKPSKRIVETPPNNANYEILDISRNGIYGNKKQYGVAYVGNDSHAKLHRSKLC